MSENKSVEPMEDHLEGRSRSQLQADAMTDQLACAKSLPYAFDLMVTALP